MLTRDLSPEPTCVNGRQDIQGPGHVTQAWVELASLGTVGPWKSGGRQPLLSMSRSISFHQSSIIISAAPPNNASRVPASPFTFPRTHSASFRVVGRAAPRIKKTESKEAQRGKSTEKGTEGRKGVIIWDPQQSWLSLTCVRPVRPVLSFASGAVDPGLACLCWARVLEKGIGAVLGLPPDRHLPLE